MALKDIWTNKTDGVDDILADDINAIANEVISNTENKADISAVTTLSESISNHEGHISNLLILTSAHEEDIARIDAEKAVKSEVDAKFDEVGAKIENIENSIGDIGGAIDNIIALQNSYIGGDDV